MFCLIRYPRLSILPATSIVYASGKGTLAGPVEDTDACRTRFAGYLRNARRSILEQPAYLPGLYINIAHGSSGLTSTPLAAEYLASLIGGESLPLLCDDIQALHPLRFLVRELKRQKG